jgi:magnesium-transporting ATPase (P-type)
MAHRLNFMSFDDHKVKNFRLIDLQNPQSKSSYPSNEFTSKPFTALTLLPTTIIREFGNLSYFWYCFVIFCEFFGYIPQFSARWYVPIALGLIFLFKLIKNIFSYLMHYKTDEIINSVLVHVWNREKFISTKSKNINVGDIILINNNEFVPADILLLACKDSEKICYLNKKKLNGNKRLVMKKPLKEINSFFETENFSFSDIFERLENVKVTPPNKSFKKFKGKIKIRGNPKALDAGLDQFIIGGSKVVINDWIIGLVVYTGMETKFWINSKTDTYFKLSKFEVIINKIHVINFIIIFLLVLISSLVNYFFSNFLPADHPKDIIINYVILYCNFIPVSLFVCVRLSQFLEVLIIGYSNKKVFINNQRVMEDLGKVEYVLTVKSSIISEQDEVVSVFAIKDMIYINDKFNVEPKNPNSSYKLLKSATNRENFK